MRLGVPGPNHGDLCHWDVPELDGVGERVIDFLLDALDLEEVEPLELFSLFGSLVASCLDHVMPILYSRYLMKYSDCSASA